MTNAPGKMFLQVTSILLIIGAAFSILGSLVIILGGGVAASGALGDSSAQSSGVFLILLGVFTLVVGVFDLITGICGLKNCNKPEKAALCVKLGTILIVLSALSNILSLISAFSVQGVFSLLAGLVLPILYVMGAKKNQNAGSTVQ